MKVKELIEKLKEFDQELEVTYESNGCTYDVEKVTVEVYKDKTTVSLE